LYQESEVDRQCARCTKKALEVLNDQWFSCGGDWPRNWYEHLLSSSEAWKDLNKPRSELKNRCGICSDIRVQKNEFNGVQFAKEKYGYDFLARLYSGKLWD